LRTRKKKVSQKGPAGKSFLQRKRPGTAPKKRFYGGGRGPAERVDGSEDGLRDAGEGRVGRRNKRAGRKKERNPITLETQLIYV